MYRLLLVLFMNCCVAHFNSVYGNPFLHDNDTSTLTCRQIASRQLDEALSLMQKHYYRKNDINWDSLVTAAKARLSAAENCEDAFAIVNWCFHQLSESHSYIMPTARAALYNNDTVQLKRTPRLAQLVGEIKSELYPDRGIAYISVPWVSTTDSAIGTRIADSIQQLIASLDQSGISKWIIDLRKNIGGNCWPMLAGIGPLLGDGVCGFFVNSNERVPIIYRNGAAMQGSHVRCRISGNAYKTKYEKKNIIVLTGSKTSSSGEIVALAFKGKEGALQYGEPTAGFTTANSSYILSDKSMLVLTVSMEADRTGKVYEGALFPDETIVVDPENDSEDKVKWAAIMWLHIL